jgi:hypothetical protein
MPRIDPLHNKTSQFCYGAMSIGGLFHPDVFGNSEARQRKSGAQNPALLVR